VGGSKSIQELKRKIHLVANDDISVLIEGETGTGKEIVAQLIHSLSPRGSGPFKAIDCPAIPDSIFENELFGHEKGAYTGAEAFQKGIIGQADGGTLLLDEVDKLSVAAQAKLLRFLQQREFNPLGCGKPTHADVRIVAASGKNLAADMEDGSFRKDLFFRLRGVVLNIPPLRDRPEDILTLAEHFISRHTKPKAVRPRLDPAAARLLLVHSWPGNARELENKIHSALLGSTDGVIRPCNLDLSVGTELQRIQSLREALEACTRNHVLRAFTFSDGSCQKTADLLGIHRRTLLRLLEKHRIDEPTRRQLRNR